MICKIFLCYTLWSSAEQSSVSDVSGNDDTWPTPHSIPPCISFYVPWIKNSSCMLKLLALGSAMQAELPLADLPLPAVSVHTSSLISCTQPKFFSIPQCTLRSLVFFSFFSYFPSPPTFSARTWENAESQRCMRVCRFDPRVLTLALS